MSTKRTKWVKSVFNQDAPNMSIAENPPKKLKSSPINKKDISNESSNVSFPTTTIQSKQQKATEALVQSANWMDCFVPQTTDDLAVHAKKIQEVHDWLRHCELDRKNNPAQICLITGPAGTGKTATVRVLAKQLKYQLVEWINPLDSDVITVLGDQEISYVQSQAEIFKGFLFRSSRYKSVLESMEKRLVLVEDFPNIFIKDSGGFSDILENYLKYGKSPLVFIATDSRSKKLNISYNLFPDIVKAQFRINHISFNPVSTTLMKKALKRICTLMTGENYRKYYKPPSADMIDAIDMAAQGDMRNAIINLHFGSLKGAPSLGTVTLKSSKLSKTRSKTHKKLSSVGRDETITMMHALGRVFNPKYSEGSTQLLHSPEDLADAFSMEPKTFLDFVHTNYLGHFGTIENIIPAADSLSLSDNIISEYREDSLGLLGLNVGIRGVMVSNTEPVTGWMPVRGPKRMDIDTSAELAKLGLNELVSSNLLATDYRCFVRVIKSET